MLLRAAVCIAVACMICLDFGRACTLTHPMVRKSNISMINLCCSFDYKLAAVGLGKMIVASYLYSDLPFDYLIDVHVIEKSRLAFTSQSYSKSY